MKKLVAVMLAVLTVMGCKKDTERDNAPPVAPTPATASVAPIEVTRVGMVRDSIAYEGYRGVYIITDKRTGREYIGVSGIGISEVGSHMVGKARHEDER